jgi:hypothetical protein
MKVFRGIGLNGLNDEYSKMGQRVSFMKFRRFIDGKNGY